MTSKSSPSFGNTKRSLTCSSYIYDEGFIIVERESTCDGVSPEIGWE